MKQMNNERRDFPHVFLKERIDPINVDSLVRKRGIILGCALLVCICLFSLVPVAYSSGEDREANTVSAVVAVDGISKTNQTATPNGGAYTVNVTLGSSIKWTASTNVSWITLSTTVGTESMTVQYSVTANNDGVAKRIGRITFVMGGKSYRLFVSQNRWVVWSTSSYNSASGVHTATETNLPDGIDTSFGSVVTGIGDVTSFYGARFTATNSSLYRHWAMDIDVGDSTNVIARAALSGKVIAVGYDSISGNYVIVEHTVDGTTLRTKYLHLASVSVSVDQYVNAQTKVGIVGATGSASGDLHLHFAVLKKINNGSSSVFYHINPLQYYHGSDDRGTRTSTYNSNHSLNSYSNNAMYTVNSSNRFIANSAWDGCYSNFTAADTTSTSFYRLYLNALRDGQVIEIAIQ